MERFLRTQSILGEKRFHRLQQAVVTVVGVGAVGGYVVEGLARSGIGALRLVDCDRIQLSNMNRQILALETTIHRPKVAVAKERVQAINPRAKVETLELFAARETLMAILTPKPDLLIDAIDSLNPKVQLLSAAVSCNLPVISSMGAALRTDPALIRSGDISQTSGCPLARRVRKRLRREGITTGVDCVYSTEKLPLMSTDPAMEEPGVSAGVYAERGRTRSVLGSLPTLSGIFGLMIANMAIRQLAGE
ncbi:MAG: tRNA threonylcarbamoyladenosine dehydratase [Desulfobulbus propionicus]|nr:MAG: tRNA threonylcarbamoyladenosine dehydratase [Desulfobulbus propionicus]